MISDGERLAAEHACNRLVMQYAIAADTGEFDRAADCYVPDGRLTIAGKTHAGRAAIRTRLAHQPADQVSRHVVSNVLIDVIDSSNARGCAYVTIYRGTRRDARGAGPLPLDAPFLVGMYDDRYVNTSDGWRLSERTLVTTFRRTG